MFPGETYWEEKDNTFDFYPTSSDQKINCWWHNFYVLAKSKENNTYKICQPKLSEKM